MEKRVSPLEAVSTLKEVYEAELIGDYSGAYQLLAVFWNDFRVKPDIRRLPADIVAEVYLRCGSIAGYLGRSGQPINAQEISRNLLTEAAERYERLGTETKIAECENYFALSFERTGDIKNARAHLEAAFAKSVSINHPVRLYSHIISSMLDLNEKKYPEVVQYCAILESLFQQSENRIYKGCFYNHYGLALKNCGKIEEALDKYLTARYFFYEAEHHQYCGAAENNVASLYLSERQFKEAHNFAQKAENSFKLVGDFSRQGFSLDTRANIFLSEGDSEKALDFANKAIKLLQNGENPGFLAEACLTKIKILLKLKRRSEAIELLRDTARRLEKNDERIAKNFAAEIERLNIDRSDITQKSIK